jgi:hypothetical protein
MSRRDRRERFSLDDVDRNGIGTSKGANSNLHAWMQRNEKQDI